MISGKMEMISVHWQDTWLVHWNEMGNGGDYNLKLWNTVQVPGHGMDPSVLSIVYIPLASLIPPLI